MFKLNMWNYLGVVTSELLNFRLEDAVNLITLYHMLHPDCESAREAQEQDIQGIDLIKV